MDKKKFVINFAFYACIIAMLVLVYKYLLPVILPFIIGFIFAAIANGIVRNSKSRFKRAATLSAIYLVFVVLIILLGAYIIHSVTDINYMSLYYEKIVPITDNGYKTAVSLVNSLPLGTQKFLYSLIDSVSDSTQTVLLSLSGTAVSVAANIITSLPGLFLSTMVSMIASYYIALDYENITSSLFSVLPKKLKELIDERVIFTKERVGKFIFAYSKLMALNFVECMIGYTLLGIDGAFYIAVVTTVVDVLPILGTGTVLIPWGILCLFTNRFRGVCLLIMYVLITVVRNSVEPKVVGTSINLHPLMTFVCMIVGLHFAGIAGLFILPMIAAFIGYLKETKPEFLKSLFE